jgi:hypothetical protein
MTEVPPAEVLIVAALSSAGPFPGGEHVEASGGAFGHLAPLLLLDMVVRSAGCCAAGTTLSRRCAPLERNDGDAHGASRILSMQAAVFTPPQARVRAKCPEVTGRL